MAKYDVAVSDRAWLSSQFKDANARIMSLRSEALNGVLGPGRIPALDASKITSGTFDAARIPALDASKITSGTLDQARLPTWLGSKRGIDTLDTGKLTSWGTDRLILTDGGQTRLQRGDGRAWLQLDGSSLNGGHADLGSRDSVTIWSAGNVNLYGQSGTPSLILGNDGNARLYGTGIYTRTYTNSANMVITEAGTLGRSTSLKSAKLDVHDVERDPYAILNIPYREWTDRGSVERAKAGGYDDENKRQTNVGVVAEEVEEYAPELVTHNSDTGELNGVSYDRIGPALLPLIRSLVNRIEVLEGKPQTEWPESPIYDDSELWDTINAIEPTVNDTNEPQTVEG